MTDLDTLRRALQAPPAADLGRLPIGPIMARGRRLRRRRRILAGAGTAALAAVLVTVIASTGESRAPSRPRHMVPALSPGHSVSLRHNAPYGSVIATGIRGSAGELVFYAVRIHLTQLPMTTFGVMAGYREPDGKLTGDVESNEFSGPDTAPGFHAVEAPMTANGHAVPEFGYYAGPAARIVGTVDGRTIRADQARWSVNPKIVIFWFPAHGNPAAQPVTGMAAYNARGKLLPAGHASPGLG